MGEELKFVSGKGLLDGEEVVAEFDVRVLTIYFSNGKESEESL